MTRFLGIVFGCLIPYVIVGIVLFIRYRQARKGRLLGGREWTAHANRVGAAKRLPRRSAISPVLDSKGALDSYEDALKGLGRTALFHYGFVISLMVAFRETVEGTTPFLSVDLSRLGWAYVGNVGAIALNSYTARRVRYLSKLLWMHPEQRRRMRFVTWNHPWFLNPFRSELPLRRGGAMLPSGLYMLTVGLTLFPSIHMLDGHPSLDPEAAAGGAWFTLAAVSALGLLNMLSQFALLSAIWNHNNLMWKGLATGDREDLEEAELERLRKERQTGAG